MWIKAIVGNKKVLEIKTNRSMILKSCEFLLNTVIGNKKVVEIKTKER